jgi:hypothetical protein
MSNLFRTPTRELEEQAAEIQKELERRANFVNVAPKKLHVIDWNPVIDLAQYYIGSVYNGNVDMDDEHYIFEAVVNAVYGEGVWDFIQKYT